MDHNIWPTISGEHIDTPITGTLQSALMQQPSGRLTRARTRNIYREDQFDSGLWEPDDLMYGVEGIFFVSNRLMKIY
jgi:hypothetical protein